MRILKLTITAEEEGKKVKQLMRGTWQISSGLLKSLKWRENAILLNGLPVTVAAIVHAGDELTVNIADDGELSPHIVPVDYPLDILFEDDDLLILNKPAGIAVHSAALTQETVTVAGDPVALTPKEYDILRFLMRNAGTVFSPNEIYRRVWEDVPLNAAGAIAVHIRHLREKLEINPSEPRYIKVVWGKGYKMEGSLS